MPCAVTEMSSACAERDHGGNDGRVVRVRAETGYERAVDLEGRHGQIAQHAQRAVLRTEIVDAELDTEGVQLVQDRRAPIADIQQRGFGDLEDEQVRIQARTRERLGDRAEQVVGDELPRREVDRDRERPFTRGLADPLRALATRGLEHRGTDGHDQPVVLGDREELGWCQDAVLGVLPAQQRLEPGDLTRVEADDRLVVDAEFTEVDGLAHRRAQRGVVDLLLARKSHCCHCPAS